jgi:hypothetical protein
MMRTTISAAVSFLMVLCFFTTVIAGEVSRLVPTDKVIVFKDGKKIAEYTKEMPVPESVILSCNGKCGIKLDDISIVGEDQSRFLIDSAQNNRYLGVEEGIVYFGISTMPRKIIFMTPKGAVSANQVFIEASSNNRMVEGYIKVSDDISEIGVIDGGSLQILTNDGHQLLKPGQRFILAQAEIGAEASNEVVVGTFTTQGGFFENLTNGQIAFGTTAAIVGGVSTIGAILHDKDSPRPASPSQP